MSDRDLRDFRLLCIGGIIIGITLGICDAVTPGLFVVACCSAMLGATYRGS